MADEVAREQARMASRRHGGVLAALRNPRVLRNGLLTGLLSDRRGHHPGPIGAAGDCRRPTGTVGEARSGWIVSLGGGLGAAVMVRRRRLSPTAATRAFSDALRLLGGLMALGFLVHGGVITRAWTTVGLSGRRHGCFTVPARSSAA